MQTLTNQDTDTEREVYTVSQLNLEARDLLDSHFAVVWVQGEISNFAQPRSGHMYFSLKDENAQVRGAMFRMANRLLNFQPEDGMQVLARARVSIYPERGDFQLIVDYLEETGDGLLRQAFEKLKKQLHTEGLFASDHKKPLPTLPQQIGVITSPSGAAIRDVLTVLERRFPAIPVIIYPSAVQGHDAPIQLIEAIQTANHRQECDVLLLTRGGGSLEDLWAFNDETLARTIFSSDIPIISAVGHEIDISISDFVADARAATPSAAAELLSPDGIEWLHGLIKSQNRLFTAARYYLQHLHQNLQHLHKRLKHPGRQLQDQAQRVDQLEHQLQRAFDHYLHQRTSELYRRYHRLQQCSPQQLVQTYSTQLQLHKQQFITATQQQLQNWQQQLAVLARSLDNISPLATLSRGYSIISDAKTGTVIDSANNTQVGAQIRARLAKGELLCEVLETNAK